MHIKVFVVYEEALAYSAVSVRVCVDVKPKFSQSLRKSYFISSGKRLHLLAAITTSLSVNTADMFQSFSL